MIKFLVNTFFLRIIFLNGLIVAFIKLLGISYPTSPINLITIFFTPIFVYYFLSSKSTLTKNGIAFYLFFLICRFFIIGDFNPTDTFGLFHIILALTSFYYFFTVNINTKIKNLLVFKNYTYFFMALFLLQYLFYSILPKAFTEIPNLFFDVGVDKYTRNINGDTFYRPNGLIGNPITFGFVLNIFLLIEIAFYKSKSDSRVKHYLITSSLLIMIFLLFSRANFIFAFLLLTLPYIKRKNIMRILFSITILLLSFSYFNDVFYTLSSSYRYMSDRLSGNDDYASSSTLEHLGDYLKAYNYFIENPILGVSHFEIINKEIITDGAIPILILQNGTIGFMILLLYYLNHSKNYFKKRDNHLNKMFFIFSILLIPYCILNSALLNKGVFLIVFVLLGLTSNLFYTKAIK